MTFEHLRARAAVLLLVVSGCGGDDDGGALPGYKDVNNVDPTFLDRGADPCSDFYQFACGTWVREHPVDEYPAQTRFHEGLGRNNVLLRRILERRAPVAAHPAVSEFYESCLDAAALSGPDRALDTKLRLIASMRSVAELPSVLGELHRTGVSALFGVWPIIDPSEPSRLVPTLYPYLTLPGPEYYLDPEFDVRPEFELHMSEVFRIYSPANSLDAAAVSALETHLAEAVQDQGEARDPRANHHLLTLTDLEAAAPSFAWRTYFAAVGATQSEVVNVQNLDYLAAVERELANAPLAAFQSYLAFRTLESYSLSLGDAMAQEEARFHGGVFYGDPTARGAPVVCQEQALQVFAAELAKPFVAYRSSPEDRSAVTAMATGIVDALRRSLEESSWLDTPSRDAAEAKLSAMLFHIGFPDQADWPKSTFPPTGVSYLASRIGWRTSVTAEAWAAATKPADRSQWNAVITEANAWYSSLANRVTAPAGILQLPHFERARRSVLNYGALGSLLGHEVTHGFDNNGRWFDGEGRLQDWWSETSASAYTERAQCLVDEYDAFEVRPGLAIDGQATLGENIADLGGLKLAYAAYHASGARDGAAGGFDVDQQFFLSYAQVWCANYSDELLEYIALTDPHALERFRVNGVVRNMPEFARAFACPAGAPLAPLDRCSIF